MMSVFISAQRMKESLLLKNQAEYDWFVGVFGESVVEVNFDNIIKIIRVMPHTFSGFAVLIDNDADREEYLRQINCGTTILAEDCKFLVSILCKGKKSFVDRLIDSI
jgi:hypothetical protein